MDLLRIDEANSVSSVTTALDNLYCCCYSTSMRIMDEDEELPSQARAAKEYVNSKHLELLIVVLVIAGLLFILIRLMCWFFNGGFKPSREFLGDQPSVVTMPEPSLSALSAQDFLNTLPTSRIDYACDWADRELLNLQRCTW